MKVLFLDIDGVVNCEETRQRHRGAIGIDPVMAFKVGQITLGVEDLNIVLSSSWRKFPQGREEVEAQIAPMFDETPTSQSGIRGDEIKMWLDAHPEVERYAILDDDSDMLEEQMPNFFQTTWKTGLTDTIVEKVIEHLNK